MSIVLESNPMAIAFVAKDGIIFTNSVNSIMIEKNTKKIYTLNTDLCLDFE